MARTPAQLSGGQRQRVLLARALAMKPKLLLADEPVSALDASNRNHVLRLFEELRETIGLTIVIISHDLSSLAGIADRVAVLYGGHLVEQGPIQDVLHHPEHPYTALLAAAAPSVRQATAAAVACGGSATGGRCADVHDRLRVRGPVPVRDGRVHGLARPRRPTRRPYGRLPPRRHVGRSAHQPRSERMTIEFLGMIGTHTASEIHPPNGPVVDRDYTRRFARAHEDGGFDRILIGYGSGWPDGTQVAAYVAAHTERLGLLVAHRPGFMAPTLAVADVRDAGPVQRRPGRGAHDHRRQQRRAAARRRLPGQGRAVRPDGRVSGDPQEVVDVRGAVRLPGPALPFPGLRQRGQAGRTHPAVLRRIVRGGVPGRRQARGDVHAVGRAAGRDRRSRSPRYGRRRSRPGVPTRRGSASRSARSWVRPRNSRGSGRTRSCTP